MANVARVIARAKSRGDAPISTALLRAAGFSVALLCLPWLGKQAASLVVQSMREALTLAKNMASAPDPQALLSESSHFVADALLAATLPVMGILALVTVVLGVLQGRGIWRWPKMRKPGGFRGPGIIGFSIGVVLWFSCVGLFGARLGVWSGGDLSAPRPSDAFWALLVQLCWTVAGVTLLGSLFDAWWVQLSWRQRNTLPPWEERREQRQREVAPELRSAQRQRSRELLG